MGLKCPLHQLSFEIRVYSLHGRQQTGIAVSNARNYISNHGGVKIYDNGFRLPYYGLEHDWLEVEVDHSHRLSQSKILPPPLQVSGGLSNLPTQTRLLGFVFVNTGQEAQAAPAGATDYLQIQVTRDRLVDNAAYRVLRDCVRFALDWYAMRETLRKINEAEREIKELPGRQEKLRSVDKILARHVPPLTKAEANQICKQLKAIIDDEAVRQELLSQNINLLGTLATAGMLALAFEHEIARQITVLEQLLTRLQFSKTVSEELPHELDKWIRRARETRTIFASLSDEESRMKRQRFVARSAIERFVEQSKPFLRGIDVDIAGIDDRLKLPRGSFAEWSAFFQNLFANAANAMIDKKIRRIAISSQHTTHMASILVQDTGVGIDLAQADKLFEPFERRIKISNARRSLAIGGTGLGLTIVRLIAQNLNCSVSFVRPRPKFATCFKLEWRERG